MTEAVRALHEVARTLGVPRDATLGVAVSGGSDSLALLVLMHQAGWRLEVATVDHGLRPEAADEAAFVARHCADLDVPHTVLTVDLAGTKGNLQDQARRARYSALQDWAGARGITHVVLGHTMDDQAETFLMRIARGAGLDGLSGMRAFREDGAVTWVRPFLTCRRSQLQQFLEQRGLAWVDDPSNEDARYERVRMRKALDVLEPLGLTPERIGEVSANLRNVQREVDLRARDAVLACCREEAGDLVFPKDALRPSDLGQETRRRLLAAALRWVSGAEYSPRRDAMLHFDAAVTDGETHTLSGCVVTSGDDIRLTREFNAVRAHSCPSHQLWDGRWACDGPHDAEFAIRALGEAVKDTPWRDTGIPRRTLLATPAIWRKDTLIAAPSAGLPNGWTAKATGRGKFADFLISR